eukprot:CAMPEP_0201479574 /NCGR_PEP_ID=MMETSP0151_2-20130828/4265_1 /ASSEMBLY_ACC=CAM_ASM_000257 /TAXON_ID=200890 /ORGANISM="Paramoeba atlantica, Strain 621/1 / CCAP 1560/9" /LENGTH=266 /DNA_ID=CAMNT_0047861141 /DNA_START=103 /DNA_END=904 /DNA_ORIENTATION=+
MPAGVTEDEVRDFFGSCGTIVDIYLKDNGLDTFGFVGFESLSSQADAMRFDGRDFKGSNIRVEAKGRPRGGGGGASGRDAFKVFVGGLARELSDDEIRSFFEKKVGSITDFFRKEEGPFAFVGFGSAREQAEAMRMDGQDLGGSRIRVQPKGGAPPPPPNDGRGALNAVASILEAPLAVAMTLAAPHAVAMILAAPHAVARTLVVPHVDDTIHAAPLVDDMNPGNGLRVIHPLVVMVGTPPTLPNVADEADLKDKILFEFLKQEVL